MKKILAFLLAPVAAVTLLATHDAPAAIKTYDPTMTCVRVDGVLTCAAAVSVVDTQTAAGTTTDATLKLGPPAAGSAILAWMTSTLDGQGSRKRVEILEANASTVTASQTLDQPFIQQMELPALGPTRDPARWTVRLANTTSRATGPQASITRPAISTTKAAITGNFRVQIDGIDGSRIVSVEPLIVQSRLLPPPPRPARMEEPAPMNRRGPAPPTSTSSISNLVLTMSPTGSTISGFQQWLAGDHAPRAGAIVFLAPNLQDTLYTVRLKNVVITKITTSTSSASDSTSTARAELTVGGLALSCP